MNFDALSSQFSFSIVVTRKFGTFYIWTFVNFQIRNISHSKNLIVRNFHPHPFFLSSFFSFLDTQTIKTQTIQSFWMDELGVYFKISMHLIRGKRRSQNLIRIFIKILLSSKLYYLFTITFFYNNFLWFFIIYFIKIFLKQWKKISFVITN